MTAPQFSWGIDENSDGLRIQVVRGERSVSWVVTGRSPAKLAKIFREIAQELSHTTWQPVGRPLRAPVSVQQDPEVPELDQQTEEASKAALAAKAEGLTRPGGKWFSNMNQDTEIPLVTMGRGDPE